MIQLHIGGAQRGFGKLGGQLSHAPEVQSLLTMKVLAVLESLLGEDMVAGVGQSAVGASTHTRHSSNRGRAEIGIDPFPTAQIALRFPEFIVGDPPDISGIGMHLSTP